MCSVINPSGFICACIYNCMVNAIGPETPVVNVLFFIACFSGLMNRDFELASVRNNPKHINHTNGTGAAMSIAANRISYVFNFSGPSLSIDCACSSSLVALHLACQAIKQGRLYKHVQHALGNTFHSFQHVFFFFFT